MTEDEALAAIMDVIRADLPEAETRIEIGKILEKARNNPGSSEVQI